VKPIDSQDHYEILEVSANAGPEELDGAYRIAASAYATESLASYSVFDEVDANVIREKIDAAYRVLSDPAARADYDRSIGYGGGLESEPVKEPTPTEVSSARPGEIATGVEAFDDLEAEAEEEQQGFDGPRLRRARLRRGIDIDEIATVTKVRTTYLECLEEGRFEDLPARVYVRGFVGAYARAIGLDSERVTETYMAYFDEAGQAEPRARLLSRR
jgi:flagellar biosynthesis protein FlhG